MFEHDEVVLEAKHVTRRFLASGGRTLVANDDINLKFYKGKTLGLVGESGCGKSTFMRFLVSLDTPSEGEILYRGKDITKLKGEELRQNRQNIQMVFQDPTDSFSPRMKVKDILCEPLENYGLIKPSEKAAKARELLKMVELPEEFAERYPRSMSGGQKQRSSIARALMKDAPILLLDDALSAVDTDTERQILDNLRRLRRGRTTIIVAHRISTIQDADHILVLDEGKVEEYGTHEELLNNGKLYASLYRKQQLEKELHEEGGTAHAE